MKFLIFVVLCLYAALSGAEQQAGKVSGYIASDSGGKALLIMQIQGNVSGGCNTTSRFAVDDGAPKFKGIQAAVMAAYHTQADVTVVYSQTCDAWGNSWDIVGVCVGNLPC